jgi:hypothetical protein
VSRSSPSQAELLVFCVKSLHLLVIHGLPELNEVPQCTLYFQVSRLARCPSSCSATAALLSELHALCLQEPLPLVLLLLLTSIALFRIDPCRPPLPFKTPPPRPPPLASQALLTQTPAFAAAAQSLPADAAVLSNHLGKVGR